MYPKTKQGNQNRSFSASWYDHFPWIEYSIESNAIYCYVCRIFGNETSEDTFVKIGFNNWKKVNFKLFLTKFIIVLILKCVKDYIYFYIGGVIECTFFHTVLYICI